MYICEKVQLICSIILIQVDVSKVQTVQFINHLKLESFTFLDSEYFVHIFKSKKDDGLPILVLIL